MSEHEYLLSWLKISKITYNYYKIHSRKDIHGMSTTKCQLVRHVISLINEMMSICKCYTRKMRRAEFFLGIPFPSTVC